MKERSPAEISFGISQTTNQHDYFHRRTKEIQDLTTIKQKMGSGTKPKVLTTSSLSWAKQLVDCFAIRIFHPEALRRVQYMMEEYKRNGNDRRRSHRRSRLLQGCPTTLRNLFEIHGPLVSEKRETSLATMKIFTAQRKFY